MKNRLTTILLASLMLVLATSAEAAKSKEQAARQAAKQHDAKVLSVKEQKQGQSSVYVVKLLTKDGVVKTVRVPKTK
jgi:uncharacterized membrane protein YkoI